MAALPVVAMGAQLAGAGLSAYGQHESGIAGQRAADYQAQVARNNAVIAQQNEEFEVQSGEVQAANSEMKTRATVGATMAGQGASGVDVNTGSFVDARAAEAESGQLDALTIRSNAARRAYNYAVAATSDTAQAGLDVAQGQQARTAGDIGALSSAVGAIGSVGSKYASWQNAAGGTGKASPAVSTANDSDFASEITW